MKRTLKIASSLLIVLASAVAFADSVKMPMQPGLWETKSTVTSSDPALAKAMAQAQEAMKNMPPEQRKMMEEMMKKQGVSMSTDGNKTVTKMCMTQAMIDSGQNMGTPAGTDCKTSTTAAANSSYRFSSSCTKPAVSTTEGDFKFNGKNSYTGVVKTRTGSGKSAQEVLINMASTWLGADCGEIKPMVMPK